MAKKKSNKKGTKNRHPVVPNVNQQHLRAGDESTAEFIYALNTCSFDRLRAIYLDFWLLIEDVGLSSPEVRRVTDAAIWTMILSQLV
eukprot:scaffold144201_cov55-Attheya_sp.AAC.1